MDWRVDLRCLTNVGREQRQAQVGAHTELPKHLFVHVCPTASPVVQLANRFSRVANRTQPQLRHRWRAFTMQTG
jgi:hypothetical protein